MHEGLGATQGQAGLGVWCGEGGAQGSQPQPGAPAAATQHLYFLRHLPCRPGCAVNQTAVVGRRIPPLHKDEMLDCAVQCSKPAFPPHQRHANSFYTLPNSTSNMLKNGIVKASICFLGSISFFFVPCPLLSESIFFCNDNSLFCPHAHLFILPL